MFRGPEGGVAELGFRAREHQSLLGSGKIAVPMCLDALACLKAAGMLTFSSVMLATG